MKKITHKFKKISFRVSLAIIGTFLAPAIVFAVVQNLNGQIGQFQSFANDSNLTINSSGNVHSLGWSGHLPVSRGGTGTGLFTSGSVLFSNGASISEDNSNLFWDGANSRLGIRRNIPEYTLDVNGETRIHRLLFKNSASDVSISPDISETSPPNIIIQGVEAGNGQNISLIAGRDSESPGLGGEIEILAGNSPEIGNGGGVLIKAGSALGGSSSTSTGNGGNIVLTPGMNSLDGIPGKIILNGQIQDNTQSLSFLSINQTFTGLNKFEADTNSTIYIGSDTKSGCIAMGDSDGNGITYISVNDGVITSSSTKPSICD